MWLTLFGLLVASLTSLYSVVTGDASTAKKSTLSVLSVLGLVLGSAAAVHTNRQAKASAEALTAKLAATETHLATANEALAALRTGQKEQGQLMDYVGSAVGQLSKLNELGGGRTYYVRLAFGQTPEELARHKTALLNRFPGGREGTLIQVRPTLSPKGYELVFGTGLTLVSAEVFERLSNLQGFANGRPEVRPETP